MSIRKNSSLLYKTTISCLCACIAYQTALAQNYSSKENEQFYVKALAGYTWPNKLTLKGNNNYSLKLGSSDKRASYGLALGYITPQYDNINLEVGLRSYKFNLDKIYQADKVGIYSNTKANVAELAGYYFVKTNFINPYVKVGLGFANIDNNMGRSMTLADASVTSTKTFNKSKTNFSYSLGVGAEACLNQNLRVGLGYTYQDMGSVPLSKKFIDSNSPFTTQMGDQGLKIKKIASSSADLYVKYSF